MPTGTQAERAAKQIQEYVPDTLELVFEEVLAEMPRQVMMDPLNKAIHENLAADLQLATVSGSKSNEDKIQKLEKQIKVLTEKLGGAEGTGGGGGTDEGKRQPKPCYICKDINEDNRHWRDDCPYKDSFNEALKKLSETKKKAPAEKPQLSFASMITREEAFSDRGKPGLAGYDNNHHTDKEWAEWLGQLKASSYDDDEDD